MQDKEFVRWLFIFLIFLYFFMYIICNKSTAFDQSDVISKHSLVHRVWFRMVLNVG